MFPIKKEGTSYAGPHFIPILSVFCERLGALALRSCRESETADEISHVFVVISLVADIGSQTVEFYDETGSFVAGSEFVDTKVFDLIFEFRDGFKDLVHLGVNQRLHHLDSFCVPSAGCGHADEFQKLLFQFAPTVQAEHGNDRCTWKEGKQYSRHSHEIRGKREEEVVQLDDPYGDHGKHEQCGRAFFEKVRSSQFCCSESYKYHSLLGCSLNIREDKRKRHVLL